MNTSLAFSNIKCKSHIRKSIAENGTKKSNKENSP